MRRSILLLAAAVCAMAAASAQAQPLVAPIDQTVTVTLPDAAADVIIGNPTMIDVSLLNARQAVVMGKAYGVTSFQVFDKQGRSIYARQVVVSSADDNRVSYFRGSNLYNYSCAPRCERTPMPGELKNVYDDYVSPYTGYADRQKNAAAPAPGAAP